MAEKPDEKITDPKALRALAHPLRWKLIELLSVERTATATRCAEEFGESVANCSYHLNTLARYGYVAQAEGGQGREKPWRLARTSESWAHGGEGMGVEGALAAEALSEVFLDHENARTKEWLRRRSREPEPWREATGITGVTTFLTVEEMAEVTAELRKIASRYPGRSEDPALRPAGARPVRIFLSTRTATAPEPT